LAHFVEGKVGREKMRTILLLALFFTCLSAASAASDPLTERNNDASLRKTRWWMPDPLPKFQRSQPVHRPPLAPTK
jgi:hypothetical protein